MIRQPAVAGRFYPGNPSQLKEELDDYMTKVPHRKKVIGLIVPHAGYMFSGGCAGNAYGRVEIPKTVVIIGINHQTSRQAFVVDNHDYWKTPLGDIGVDKLLRGETAWPVKTL